MLQCYIASIHIRYYSVLYSISIALIFLIFEPCGVDEVDDPITADAAGCEP